MKKRTLTALLLTAMLLLPLTACGEKEPERVELTVFAAASLTESMDQIIELYKDKVPSVTVVPNYDSSGTLKTQIEEGAVCDLFLSAAPKQMDQLDELELVDQSTRLDLLENKVVLVVPEGNPKGIETFDQLAELLKTGGVLMAMGNSDVPVGQYTQNIFAFYGLDESALAASLTYGSNVKEVTTQVSESVVDCGVVYATDAFSAGLEIVDEAAAEQCGQVIYPAAVLKPSEHQEEAAAFLEFLKSSEGMAQFEAVGFSPAG